MSKPRIRVQPVHIALAVAVVALAVVGVQMVNASPGPGAGPAPAVSSPAAPDGQVVADSPAGAAAETPAPAGQTTPGAPPVEEHDDHDDGADDGVDDGQATAAPDPADVTAARTAAMAFTAAWLNTTNKTPDQWRADLASHITPALANDLAAADPSTVPVGQIGSPITVTVGQGRLANVTIPITTGGAVTVTVVLDGRPLVSDVDWVKP